jgi:hypothetical protein
VDEGLAGKQEKIPINEAYKGVRVVHGRNANQTKPTEIPASMGNWANNIASYSEATAYGDHDNGGTIVTTTPQKPYQAANKKYVDEEIAKASGIAVMSIEVGGNGWNGVSVPDGALPNFYLASDSFEYSTDGNGGGFKSANYSTLTFYDESDNSLGSVQAESKTFYEMPSGTVRIMTNASEIAESMGDWDVFVIKVSPITFMVKVGA